MEVGIPKDSSINWPKSLRLGGLKTVGAQVFFAVKQILYRNIYGEISEDEGIELPYGCCKWFRVIEGITSISCSEGLNTKYEYRNFQYSREGRNCKCWNTVQVYLSPNNWANPPLIYTGYVST